MSTAADRIIHAADSAPVTHQSSGARLFRWRGLALLLGLGVLLGGATWGGWWSRLFPTVGTSVSVHVVQSGDLDITLSENGELKPRKSIEVKCVVEGMSTILTIVPESTRVKKDDLLVELASNELSEKLEMEEIELKRIETDAQAAEEELEIQRNQNVSDIRKAEIDLEIAELELNKYRNGDYKKELKSIEIDITKAEAEITRKKSELQKNEELRDKGFVNDAKVRDLKYELDNAEMTLEKARLQREILETFDKKKSETQKSSDMDRAREELVRVSKRAESKEKQALVKMQQTQAQLAVRKGRVDRVREQVAKCRILSPADGMVQYPTERGWDFGDGGDRIVAGAKVREGQTLVVLPDTSQMIVQTRIHEADRHKVKEGMECHVRIPAVPGKSFVGKVAKIARFADSANRWLNPELKEHTTEILLDATDAPVSPGDSAEIKILIETVPNALTVPVQTVFPRGPKNFVFVRRGFSFEPAEVAVGRSGTNTIEITRGLAAGDAVAMAADPEMLAKLPTATAADDGKADLASPKRAAPDAQAGRRNPAGAAGAARKARTADGGGVAHAEKSESQDSGAQPADSQPAANSESSAPDKKE